MMFSGGILMEIILRPLSGRGLDISVEYDEYNIHIHWGKSNFKIKKSVIEDIEINFFKYKDEWYPLGACVDNPMKYGLGQYITKVHKLNPKQASVIAAIMYKEGLIQFRGKKPIELKKI
jgi:hypothetical protein